MKPEERMMLGVLLVVVGLAAILIVGTDIELSVPVTQEPSDEDISLIRIVLGPGFIAMGVAYFLALLKMKRRKNDDEDGWKGLLRRR